MRKKIKNDRENKPRHDPAQNPLDLESRQLERQSVSLHLRLEQIKVAGKK